jgi:Complex I intermediate-associated protein 30 (CIA30)
MGGRSASEVRWRDAALEFTGTISLENGGGFASLLSPELGAAALSADAIGMIIDAISDGKTYVMQLRIAGATAWVARFTPEPSVRTTTTIEWSQFEPVDRFLNPIATNGRLNPTEVDALAIYILDKQEGDFALSIYAIG